MASSRPCARGASPSRTSSCGAARTNQLGGGARWAFFAEGATGYEPAAVDVCVAHLKLAEARFGLREVHVVLTSRMVRMGARLVAMLSGIDMRLYGSATALERGLLAGGSPGAESVRKPPA